MRSLAIFSLAYASAAMVQKGLGFVLFLWLAYSLTPEDYAIFALLLALQVGVATLAGAGVSESVVGLLKDHNTPQGREWLFSAANGVFLHLSMLGAILGSIVFALPLWDATPALGTQILVLVGGVLTAFFTLHANLVRLEERHFASIALGALAPLIGHCAAFVAFYTWRDVPAFYAGATVGLSLAILAFYYARVGHFRFSPSAVDTSPIRKAISPYIFIALLAWLGGYGNTYIVQALFTATDVAKFAFAYTLSSVMHLVATSTNQVWAPRFFHLVQELSHEDMERRNLRFFATQGLAIGAVGALVLLFLPAMIDRVGGNLLAYRDMQLELFLLFSGYAVSIPWWHSQNYYLVYGFGKELRNVVFATTVMGLATWLICMDLLGPIGIYAGFLAYMLIRSAGALLWARRRWPISVAWQGPLVALVLLAVGGVFARSLLPPPG